MTNFILILLAITIAFMGLTWLLHRSFRHRWVKYLPAVLTLGIAIQNFYMARFAPSEGFADLARIVLMMMAAVAFIAGLATAIYLDYRRPNK